MGIHNSKYSEKVHAASLYRISRSSVLGPNKRDQGPLSMGRIVQNMMISTGHHDTVNRKYVNSWNGGESVIIRAGQAYFITEVVDVLHNGTRPAGQYQRRLSSRVGAVNEVDKGEYRARTSHISNDSALNNASPISSIHIILTRIDQSIFKLNEAERAQK